MASVSGAYLNYIKRLNLNNTMITELCEQFKIQHHNSSPYWPKMNGVVEAENKNIKKIVQKMIVTYKEWHEMLPFALHGYRTSAWTSTGATPYSLVYGMKAVFEEVKNTRRGVELLNLKSNADNTLFLSWFV